MGELVSVNVGRPRQIAVSRRGEPVISAIGKSPVPGRVAVRGVNLGGDDQADRGVHGGPDKAVYAYASEDTAWWATRLDVELGPGALGENLTTRGVDVSGAVIGERWRIGSTELEVCQPRQPCFKLGLAFGDPMMVRHFARAGRPGAYLRIIREGELGEGDPIEILARPAHGITIAVVGRAILSDHAALAGAAAAPALAPDLAAWMRERAGSALGRS
jgi:MOSC domain-containing protein YiiM